MGGPSNSPNRRLDIMSHDRYSTCMCLGSEKPHPFLDRCAETMYGTIARVAHAVV